MCYRHKSDNYDSIDFKDIAEGIYNVGSEIAHRVQT